MEKKFLNIAEVAKMLGISRSFAYILAKTGQLPSIRLGQKRIVVSSAAFQEFLTDEALRMK